MGMKPHILAITYPTQGHVIPLLELMQWLSKQGFKVTFVNTEFNHTRVLNSLSNKQTSLSTVRDDDHDIHLVSVPDGLEPWEDRNDLGKLTEVFFEINNGSDNDEKISCVIADESLGWALEVAEKMGIRWAAFWSAAAAMLALGFSIQKLLDDGIINNYGAESPIYSLLLEPLWMELQRYGVPFLCRPYFADSFSTRPTFVMFGKLDWGLIMEMKVGSSSKD
ncbi:UDP-glycosyltransferase 83A1 [Camellia lanceoleosa]|uniref:UDP-glycosyltransferase 83A1 n=1 Tax=Camellia lanceoleosa TaxID=1840588 RepID=A0ACC0HW30_9ERIC|nr:UDP-glycosyltransferase 83A1 [Camellia lanceoleosa]